MQIPRHHSPQVTRRGVTLVELMVSLSVAAILVTIAGILLFDGLESWRKEADRDTALRRALLATDRIADDLAAQPDWPDNAAPVKAFELTGQGASIAFFTTGTDTRETAVCWYLAGALPSALMRYAANADETAAALPGNAAAMKVAAAIKDGTGSGFAALETASLKWCDGVLTVRLVAPVGGIPQILVKGLTPEGRQRAAGGAAPDALPERCRIDVARPVARLSN